MARHTDAVCKLCRREGEKLFLKGERCTSAKCAFERRPYPPGLHGRSSQYRRRRESDYGRQLRAKQKARRVFGVMERQFRRYFKNAERLSGLTGENLLSLLESRLDNVVYRLGFADSRSQARQLVQHGHFMVNGRRAKSPSQVLLADDVVGVHDTSRKRTYFKERSKVLDESGIPIGEVVIVSKSQPTGQSELDGVTSSNGSVIFLDVREGSYSFQASKNGYIEETASFNVKTGETNEMILTLKAEPPASEEEPPRRRGIPGFPYESILLGLVVGVYMLLMLQRRR